MKKSSKETLDAFSVAIYLSSELHNFTKFQELELIIIVVTATGPECLKITNVT